VQGCQSCCFHQLCCPSAAALFGQLLPLQGGTIQFCMLPSVPEISSRIHHLPCFGRLVSCPTLALSLYAFPNLCWVLATPLGGWFTVLLLLSALLLFPHFTENSAPCLILVLQGRCSIPPPPPLLVLDYSSLFSFSVLLRVGVQPVRGLCWIMFPGGGQGNLV
jgi:hypothetical protein